MYMVSLVPLLWRFLAIKSYERSKKLLNIWLLVFFISLMLIAGLTTFFGLERLMGLDFFHLQGIHLYYIHMGLYVVLLVISIMPLYFPSILYGFPRTKEKTDLNSSITSPTKPKMATVTTSDSRYGLDTEEIVENLKAVEHQGYFLQQDFDLTACAQLLNIQPHHLSYYLNQHRRLSFSEYRNNVRIDKAKKMIGLGYLDMNTMEALAQECGFANRSSFSKSFKKVTKLNVTEFTSKT